MAGGGAVVVTEVEQRSEAIDLGFQRRVAASQIALVSEDPVEQV